MSLVQADWVSEQLARHKLRIYTLQSVQTGSVSSWPDTSYESIRYRVWLTYLRG